MLFSFLLAYKELECEVTIDMSQVEFFIKGALSLEKDIFNPQNLGKNSKEPRDLVEELVSEEKKFEARQTKIPWITRDQWKALDQLSKITPFNQPNTKNKCKTLSEHVEKYPQKWHDYLNGRDFQDTTMAKYTTKDDEGNSVHSSDESNQDESESESGSSDAESLMSSGESTPVKLNKDSEAEDNEGGDNEMKVINQNVNQFYRSQALKPEKEKEEKKKAKDDKKKKKNKSSWR